MNMTNIFWHQDPMNCSNDLIFVNSKVFTPPSDVTYQKFYDILHSKVIGIRNLRDFVIYKVSSGYILRGYLEDKDIDGRHIGFIFYSECENPQVFSRNLRQQTKDLNIHIDNKKILSKPSQFTSKLSRRSIVLVLLLLSFVIYFLIKSTYTNE
jgi:hypothetical protein